MTITQLESLEIVSDLILRFNEYDNIFTPVYLQYNGITRIVSLQYRLRTFQNYMDREKFINNLIEQYFQNPILIQSKLYKIHVYDRNSPNDLALDPQYIMKINEFDAFNLTNLFTLESDYIDIYIDSSFKLDLDSLISSHISRQPKHIDKYVFQYELTSLLKTNQLPESFKCLNIPLTFNMVLNTFLRHFIPKKFLIAHSEWHKLEQKRTGLSHKKNYYSQMIDNKYGVPPLEFTRRIQLIIDNILNYIKNNHQKVIGITNLEGVIDVKRLDGLYLSKEGGIIKEIVLGFETNFDNNNFATHSLITFNFNWMRSIFKKYLPKKKTF